MGERMLITRRGQSTAEYAIVVSVIIGAVVAMQIYTKRGMQAKVKDVSDTIARINDVKQADTILLTGNDADGAPNMPEQYEPYYTVDTTGLKGVDVTQTAKATETHALGGKYSKTAIDERTFRTGEQKQGGSGSIAADNAWK